MVTTFGRILATGLIVALGFGVYARTAPFAILQMFMDCVGWALAYFGDELAPVLRITSTPSTARYVEPVIRSIGWLFLLVAAGPFVASNLRLW